MKAVEQQSWVAAYDAMIRGLPSDTYYSGYVNYLEISHAAEAMPATTVLLKASIDFKAFPAYP